MADDRGAITQRDLWVANLDGSGAGRLTSSDMTRDGDWSPDGRRIAFEVDTGFRCNSAGCLGTCEIWYASSTVRLLNPLPSSRGEASAFQGRDRQGSTMRLGCELLAWLR